MRRFTCVLSFVAGLVLWSVAGAQTTKPSQHLRSRVYVYDLRSNSSHLLYSGDGIWEAPNWSPDGRSLLVNSGGTIYRLMLQPDGSATPQRLPIPADYDCNNDKALSPDGRLLGFSATRLPEKGSEVYVAYADGTHIRQMTHTAPSYFHGWSPDGATMSFVAQRNGSGQYDLYAVPTAGGPERQLNANPHHDDGPDYNPDGRWIYFNSDRSGREAIWRLPPAGAGADDARAQKVLEDGQEDWFPHLSPNGKRLVYIAYPAGTATHGPRLLAVQLKLATVNDDHVNPQARVLTTVTGGQGTLNVNSWAPDSERFAYVSYEDAAATP